MPQCIGKPPDETADLAARGDAFIARFLAADRQQREALRAAGAALASQLREQAISLAYSRATEFSPQIPLYHQLAAKVALLAFWPDEQALAIFEQDLDCYRHFEQPRPLGEAYARFREVYLASYSDTSK